MPWDIQKKITLLTVTVIFLFTFFNLILDAPRTCTVFIVQPLHAHDCNTSVNLTSSTKTLMVSIQPLHIVQPLQASQWFSLILKKFAILQAPSWPLLEPSWSLDSHYSHHTLYSLCSMPMVSSYPQDWNTAGTIMASTRTLMVSIHCKK